MMKSVYKKDLENEKFSGIKVSNYLFTRHVMAMLDIKLKMIEKNPKLEDFIEAYELLDALADSKGFPPFRINIMRRKNEREKGKIVKNMIDD